MMTSQSQFRKNDPAKAKEFFLDKISFTTGPVELSHALEQGADIVVVDVRAEEDYQKGHIPGAINLPQEKWDTYEGLNRDKLKRALLLQSRVPPGRDRRRAVRGQGLFRDGNGGRL